MTPLSSGAPSPLTLTQVFLDTRARQLPLGPVPDLERARGSLNLAPTRRHAVVATSARGVDVDVELPVLDQSSWVRGVVLAAAESQRAAVLARRLTGGLTEARVPQPEPGEQHGQQQPGRRATRRLRLAVVGGRSAWPVVSRWRVRRPWREWRRRSRSPSRTRSRPAQHDAPAPIILVLDRTRQQPQLADLAAVASAAASPPTAIPVQHLRLHLSAPVSVPTLLTTQHAYSFPHIG